ncbi:MAG: LamG-like jellyroll fold domain-containing protein, partial [Tepidisphaeraceae bacterium]
MGPCSRVICVSPLTWIITALVFAGGASGGTVALWLFNDPAGSDVAVDTSGNGRDLIIGAGAAITTGGRFGNALDADAGPPEGIGAYRDRADEALNPANKSWTLECWVKPKPGWAADNRIWGIAGTNYIALGRPNEPEGFNIANIYLPAGGKWGRPTGKIDDGNWHHLAVVYNAKSAKVIHFFDGKRKYEASIEEWRAVPFDPKFEAVFPPQYPQLQIGWRDAIQQWGAGELHGTAGPPKRFGGLIDEMRFSDEPLYESDFQP